jgi:uncharacterized protein YukJ
MFKNGAKFSPFNLDQGMHDILMNQGSIGTHAGSNGIYQDGAFFAYFPADQKWTAMFLKFDSQALQTGPRGEAL